MVGKIVRSKTFSAGDVICTEHNFVAGYKIFFKANEDDVAQYSGKKTYLKLVFSTDFLKEVCKKRNTTT